jgi:hypothetical protein
LRIRRTVYWKFGAPITLAFLACIADQHPEAVEPPPAPATANVKERRGPHRWTAKAERTPRLTDAYIRPRVGTLPNEIPAFAGMSGGESLRD